MKLDRLNRGEAIAAISAVALFVSMFLDWYGAEIVETTSGVNLFPAAGGNAWQTLELLPAVLLLTIAVTLVFTQMALLDSGWEPAIRPSAAVAVLGGISFLSILSRIVFPPDLGEISGIAFGANLKLGIFVALAAAAGIACGGYTAMRQRGTSFAKVADELGTKPARAPAGRRGKRSEKRPGPSS
jgi:hypothetical protein